MPPKLDVSGMEPQVIAKITRLHAAVEQHPDSALAWRMPGMNLYIHELHREASVCFEVAAQLDSSDSRWPYLTGYTPTHLHLPESADWLARSIRVNPRYGPACVRYGNALLRLQKYEQAIAYQPSAVSFREKGSVYKRLGDYQSAVQALENAVKLDADDTPSWRELAGIYTKNGQPEKAARALQELKRVQATRSSN